jgi:hypothetical protein
VNGPVLVAAPRFREAELWARRQGLQRTQWRYASGPEHLLGLHHGTVAIVNGYWLGQQNVWEAELRVLEATGTTVVRGST